MVPGMYKHGVEASKSDWGPNDCGGNDHEPNVWRKGGGSAEGGERHSGQRENALSHS